MDYKLDKITWPPVFVLPWAWMFDLEALLIFCTWLAELCCELWELLLLLCAIKGTGLLLIPDRLPVFSGLKKKTYVEYKQVKYY